MAILDHGGGFGISGHDHGDRRPSSRLSQMGGMIIHRCRYEKAPLAMAISISRPTGVEKLVQKI